MKFDEFTIGQIFETKSFSVTQEDIKRFSGEFDPQYMHFDEDKAARSMFKGIIASGIHTLSLSFKHWIELGIYGDDMIAGTGMDRIKFRKPVYPGDKLHTVVEVIDKCYLIDNASMIYGCIRRLQLGELKRKKMRLLITVSLKDFRKEK